MNEHIEKHRDYFRRKTMSESRRCKHAMEPSRKKQKCSKSSLVSVPNEIIVHTATFLGARDIVGLSRVSKRLNQFLMSEKTIIDLFNRRESEIHRNRHAMLLPSHSNERIRISTLQQLAFYESAKEHKLLEENRYLFDLDDDEKNDNSVALIKAVRTILKECPSASVILDAHCSRRVDDERAQFANSDYRGKLIYENIMYGPKSHLVYKYERCDLKEEYWENRMFTRSWGKKAIDEVLTSDHPFHQKAIAGKGWVEIFLRIENNTKTLELPPRPDFYSKLEAPEMRSYEDISDVDSYMGASDYDGEFEDRAEALVNTGNYSREEAISHIYGDDQEQYWSDYEPDEQEEFWDRHFALGGGYV